MRDISNLIFDDGGETTEELIGVLTAISIVSRRLAKNLSELEKLSEVKGGVKSHGKKSVAYTATR